MECSFKIKNRYGEEIYIFWIDVICLRRKNNFRYTVRGETPQSALSFSLSPKNTPEPACFDTPDKAFDFLDKIAKMYPKCSEENAPLFNGTEI